MSIADALPVASSLGTPVALLVGHLLGRRTERERGKRDVSRLTTEQFSELNSALHRDVEEMRKRLSNAEESLITTNRMLATVTAERHLDAVYIAQLVAHIEAGNPPPPPERPTSLGTAHLPF